ncbi:hypothetical protein HBP98_10415 [Listeria booriae]|uniref:Uncharacterized protein n=1 Tax=Listeria booriae TaxID=1552123 RepID=A0A7X1DRL8_9LIST|nr:hypothetical protein [Listeria booriae]MBC2372414.1 hypothetical protein [Listeria booriae]
MEQKALLNWHLNQQNDQLLTTLLKIKRLKINGFDKIDNSKSKEFVIRQLLMPKTINILVDVLEKLYKDREKENQINPELQNINTIPEMQQIIRKKLVRLGEIFEYSMAIGGYAFTQQVFLEFNSIKEMDDYTITKENDSKLVHEQRKEIEKLNARIAELESIENKEIKNHKKTIQKKDAELRSCTVEYKKKIDMYIKELAEKESVQQDKEVEAETLAAENITQHEMIKKLESELQRIHDNGAEVEKGFRDRIKELENKVKSLEVKKVLIIGDPKNQEINGIDGIKVEIIEVTDTEDLKTRLKDIIYEEMWIIEYVLSGGVKTGLRAIETYTSKPTKWFKNYKLLQKEMGVYK